MKKKLLPTLILLVCGMNMHNAWAQPDLGVTGVISPVSGCNLACNQQVKITIYNYGSTIWVTPFQVSMQINGGPVVTETASPAVFNAGATYTFTFTATANVCPHGTYNFNFGVNLAGDINPANNNLAVNIVNDTTVVPGVLGPSDSVCLTTNSGVLNLTNYIAAGINSWEYSTDNGVTWHPWANTTDTYNYSNVDSNTVYHVSLDGGYCPDNFSPWATITVVPPPVGGTALGTATVCSTGNTGQISLSGQSGSIVTWMSSPNGAAPWTPLNDSSNPYTYTNLSQSMYYYAIVSNGGYCPDAQSSSVLITAAPPTVPGNVNSNATVCQNTNSGSVSLVGNTGNILFWLMSTDGGNTWSQFTGGTTVNYSGLTDTTMYAAVVQNGICPQDTATPATITVVPAPSIYAGPDSTISLGDTICFSATGGVLYSWSPPTGLNNPGIPTPCMIATTVGTFPFTVTGQDAFGCTNTDGLVVTVLDTVTIFPPVICNFITPNNDGLNDVWNIMNIKFYPDNEVFVYNNHGQEVYHKVGYQNDWDGSYQGSQLPDGSYYYLVKFNALKRTLKGVVSITDTQ